MSRYELANTPTRFRSLFLSDLHLGSRRCHADKLLTFLKNHEADHIYLVGDTFDIWHPRAVHWTRTHDLIIDLLCERVRQGVRVINLAGNHDPMSEVLHSSHSRLNSVISCHSSVVHKTKEGKRYLVVHGDCCDFWPLRSYTFSRLGSSIDGLLHRSRVSRLLQRISAMPVFRQLILPFTRAGSAISLRSQQLLEKRLIRFAGGGGFDGIVCGHLHRPVLQHREGVLYANCGDWVQSMSAIAEDSSGELVMLDGGQYPGAEHQGTAPLLSPVRQNEGASSWL